MTEDLVFKKYDPDNPNGSPGRYVTGALFPGFHGAVAGKPGHKLKAAGAQLGGSIVGSALPGPGSLAGGAAGTHYAQKSGWLKNQPGRKKSKVTKSVWGVDHGVEIEKDYNPNKSFRSQGMAYKDKPSRKAVSQDIRRNAGYFKSTSPHRKENWKTLGAATGKGAAIGAGLGFAVRRGQGAAAGGQLGAEVGSLVGSHQVNQRAMRRGVNTGLSNGNIQTGLNRKQISFTGMRKKQS